MPDLDRTQLERASRELIVPGMKNQLYDEMPLLREFVNNNKEAASGVALIQPVPLFRTVATGIVGGYGVMVTQDQPLTVNATLPWSQLYYGNISISLDEMTENRGRVGAEKIIDLLSTKSGATKSEIKEKVYKHLHSNVSADGQGNRTLVGILAAAASTSNTYAGINRSTAANAGWKPNVITTAVTDDEFLNPTDRSKYGPSVLRRLYLAASHDNQPNIIVVTKNQYELLEFIGERNNLNLMGNVAHFSFSDIKFPSKATDRRAVEAGVIYDTYQPARHAYVLTTDDWKAWVFDGTNFDAVDMIDGQAWHRGSKQVAWYMTIGWKGQILCQVPRQQGVATALATT